MFGLEYHIPELIQFCQNYTHPDVRRHWRTFHFAEGMKPVMTVKRPPRIKLERFSTARDDKTYFFQWIDAPLHPKVKELIVHNPFTLVPAKTTVYSVIHLS